MHSYVKKEECNTVDFLFVRGGKHSPLSKRRTRTCKPLEANRLHACSLNSQASLQVSRSMGVT